MKTMQDIAEALDLSRLTVSSVINDCARERRISVATEQRVREYLDEIGYVPSRYARDLRDAPTDTAGLLYSGNLYTHLAEAFRRLSHAFEAPEALEVMLLPEAARDKGLREMIARRVSRLVWLHARNDDHEIYHPERVLPLLRRFPRMVIYNYRFGWGRLEEELLGAGVNLVGTDRCKSYRKLAERLRALGHKRVALTYLEVEEKLADAMRQTGLEVVVVPSAEKLGGPPFEQPGQELADWIIANRKRERLTAVCAGADETAGHAMVALLQHGISIPGDLSMVGHTDTPLAKAFAVPLASIRIPVDAMLGCTLTLLDGDDQARRHCFDSELIERESLGAAPGLQTKK